jgi:hypothetical protein
MASLWKHPNSRFWTACYTNKDGKQVKRSTKLTDRKKALAIAQELERVEDLVRRGTVSTLQLRKIFNDLVERTTGDNIMAPSVETYLKDWLATTVQAKNSTATAKRYAQTIDRFLKHLKDKARAPHHRHSVVRHRWIPERPTEGRGCAQDRDHRHQDPQHPALS